MSYYSYCLYLASALHGCLDHLKSRRFLAKTRMTETSPAVNLDDAVA